MKKLRSSHSSGCLSLVSLEVFSPFQFLDTVGWMTGRKGNQMVKKPVPLIPIGSLSTHVYLEEVIKTKVLVQVSSSHCDELPVNYYHYCHFVALCVGLPK